jgi:hypothetical protein
MPEMSGQESGMDPMQALDLATFRATPLIREPFDYLIVPGFVRAEARAAVNADYPCIDRPGSFPVAEVRGGPAFDALVRELKGDTMRRAFEDKFGVNLAGRPTMVTVRGRCSERDGRIHTDARTKILTVLIYMNSSWQQAGGCLRLLRSPDVIEDVIAEVPPLEGTLVAFRRSNNSYHGHKPFSGERRVIQFNWVTSWAVMRREVFRHRVSAAVKRLLRWAGYPSSAAVPRARSRGRAAGAVT